MVEGGGGTGFLVEATQALRIGGKGRGQHLHRHLPAQPQVEGPVHLPHPPEPTSPTISYAPRQVPCFTGMAARPAAFYAPRKARSARIA